MTNDKPGDSSDPWSCDSLKEARLRTELAKVRNLAGDNIGAAKEFTIAFGGYVNLELSRSDECLDMLLEFGRSTLAAGWTEQAKWCFQEILETLHKSGRGISILAADAWRGLCWVERELNNAEEQYDCARRVCLIVEQVAGRNAPCLAGDFIAVGEALLHLPHPDLWHVFNLFYQAYKLLESLQEVPSAALLPPLYGLAATFERMGNREAHQETLESIKELYRVLGVDESREEVQEISKRLRGMFAVE